MSSLYSDSVVLMLFWRRNFLFTMQESAADRHPEFMCKCASGKLRQMLGRKISYGFWCIFMPLRIKLFGGGLDSLSKCGMKLTTVSKDNIGYLPTIDAPAASMSTVFEVLCQSLEMMENLKLSSIVVAFDQVLYSRVPGDRIRFSIESTGRTEIQPCCLPTQACIRGSDETGVVRISDMDSGEAQ